MTSLTLRTVTRTQGNNLALKNGTVTPDGFVFAFEEVPVLVHAFRRMVRELAYDICEMALTTYICAKAHGVRFTALPIFLVRAFHHGAILYNVRAGIAGPKDLEGRRVGVNRGYTVTTGVWARGILHVEHGVDLDRITWVLSGDEHVAEFRPPANVVPAPEGKSLADMVVAGELAAVIGVPVDHPDVKPLIPDGLEAGLKAMRTRNHYPINHLVVVRDDLLSAHPGLAANIFAAFARAKEIYVDRLQSGRIPEPAPADDVYKRVMDVTGDPLPYGIASNRHVIEELMFHAVSQGIIDGPMAMDDLFAPETLDLTA